MKAQVKVSRSKDDRIMITVAVGEHTYRAYISDAELQNYKNLRINWETENTAPSVTSPALEIELDPIEQ